MARRPLPPPSAAIVGQPEPALVAKDWHDYFRLLEGAVSALETAFAAPETQTDFIAGIIKAPQNQSYRIIERIPYGATLTKLYAKTASGSVTIALMINATGVTGGAFSVTSTQGSATPTALNVMANGDALVLTCGSVASAVDLSFVVHFTRTV